MSGNWPDAGRNGPQRVVRQFQKRKRTLPRWEATNSVYSIRASILPERRQRLIAPAIAEVIQEALHFQHDRRCTLHFYSIMPNHVHVVIEPLARDDGVVPLPEIMHSFKSYTAHEINRIAATTGELWRTEVFNRMIRNREEYWEWYEYIRLNAFRAGLVEDPDGWPYWWARPEMRYD
jgi:putative transposase